MRPIPLASPRDMADAMRTLSDPSRHGCLPSVIQHNWIFLKEARGERVHLERIAITHHQVVRHRAPAPDPDATLDVTMPDGRTLAIPVTTSLAYQRADTAGTGGLVDELAASCARASDRVRAMLRPHLNNGLPRPALYPPRDSDGPQGAA